MDALRQILSQLKATFINLSRGKQITLLTLILGSFAGFIFLMSWTGKSEFHPIYTQLNPEDAGILISKLKEQKETRLFTHFYVREDAQILYGFADATERLS